MSERDIAKSLIDKIPENRLFYVISYLQGAAIPDEAPNDETLEAISEVEEMIQTGTGEHFVGSTADFLSLLAEE